MKVNPPTPSVYRSLRAKANHDLRLRRPGSPCRIRVGSDSVRLSGIPDSTMRRTMARLPASVSVLTQSRWPASAPLSPRSGAHPSMITVSLLPANASPHRLSHVANLPLACECASSSQLASAAETCVLSACGNNVNSALAVVSSASAVCACVAAATAPPAAAGIAGRVAIATAALH